ncbi:MAG: pyridoxal phosphate-dependent transferase [Benjaminiella poitrasii]|nr:MAG: pyridoxal phosphate-dependent transferase [Benjaminiella poitrasii]
MLRTLLRTSQTKSLHLNQSTSRYVSTKPGKVLTTETMHPLIKSVEYAVRGALPIRAEALSEQLRKDPSKLNFDKVVFCNIGNPQQLNQKPITFFRQVASLCENPELLKAENRSLVSKLYPADAIARAEVLLKNIGSVGAYSHSKGISHIRKNVAKFIERRDGYPSEPENIFLTQGASEGVQRVIQLLTQSKQSGIMIPIPQYPLYSATLSLVDASPVPYYLNEKEDWGLDRKDLEKSLNEARKNGVDVRALVIINPGNPTGQCLSEDNIREIIRFCHEERIVLLADEVYQTNIYQPERRPFHSFKKVLRSMGPEYEEQELFSFHSTSKGMIGECGRRGGYFECVNIDPEIMDQLYKFASISLCPNVQGQIMVDLMTNPPVKGDPSYEQYKSEVETVFHSLGRRAEKLAKCFNNLEGVTCNSAEGAMYLFPRIRLPNKAIKAAESAGMTPDSFYSMAMLDTTGVCVVPGSGFGQEPGTFHFRSTFLPEESLFDEFCTSLQKFHKDFMNKYSD